MEWHVVWPQDRGCFDIDMTTNECLINIFDKVPLELIIFVIYIYMFQYMYSYIFFFLVKNWFFFSFFYDMYNGSCFVPWSCFIPWVRRLGFKFLAFLIGVYDYTQIRYYCWVYPLHNVFKMFAIIEKWLTWTFY